MEHEKQASIVVADGYWMHIRHTRIHHRRYPEVRGEGRSLAAATAHLLRQLATAVDLAHGREVYEAIVQAIADVRAFRSRLTKRRLTGREGAEAGTVLPECF